MCWVLKKFLIWDFQTNIFQLSFEKKLKFYEAFRTSTFVRQWLFKHKIQGDDDVGTQN